VPQLRFAITQQQKSITGSRWYMDNWLQALSYTGSIGWRITHASILSNTGFDGLLHWVNPSVDG